VTPPEEAPLPEGETERVVHYHFPLEIEVRPAELKHEELLAKLLDRLTRIIEHG
jgi:hypothetical protein